MIECEINKAKDYTFTLLAKNAQLYENEQKEMKKSIVETTLLVM